MIKNLVNPAILTSCFFLLSYEPLSARANFDPQPVNAVAPVSSANSSIYADEYRHVAVHNAGAFHTPLRDGIVGFGSNLYDPETGELLGMPEYPRGSGLRYIFWEAIWVGGIVGEDTLVSTAIDGWYSARDFPAENPEIGGIRRTGNFADDEFVTVTADTGSEIYHPFGHTPLGLQVELKSYTWADSLYDDFIILDYTIRNIGGNDISEGWLGLFVDPDIYHEDFSIGGYTDDFAGSLDTLLYDDDPASALLIPYSFDNDGDPSDNNEWDYASTRGASCLLILDSDFPFEIINYNWWCSNGDPERDWGPRRLGTPDDPLRLFDQNNLGTPVVDVDKYYMLRHPEVDYDRLETMIHDSSDGWIPPPPPSGEFEDICDIRYLYSVGSFDLPPGDSIKFALAIVAAEELHTAPENWNDYFDPLFPHIFRETLDFSRLMTHCRRADSVYRSGYLLPRPGPPAGIKVVDYNDAYVTLAWPPSIRGDLAGYYLYLKDIGYGGQWCKATPMLKDTIGTVSIFESSHEYLFAVSLEDMLGRESVPSVPVSIIPGRPYPPANLTVTLDSLTPVLSWALHDDTTLQVFIIRRAIWNGSFELYDSTVALTYRDYGAESGVRYHYLVSAFNELGLESAATGPVTVLPMALDRGILYCNMNRYQSPNPPLYPKLYLERLFESVAARTTVTMTAADDSIATFKNISHYGLIIVDESSAMRSIQMSLDDLTCYLENGGKAVIIKPAFRDVNTTMHTTVCGSGSLYRDYLKLDSVVTNAFIYQDGEIIGDLSACQSLDAAYPSLMADTFKMAETGMPTNDCVPMSGFLFPGDEAEVIYGYVSSNPDTAHHGAVNGVKYVSENYGVVLFSFPLMALREPDNIQALKQALVDLGIDMNCGDANNDGRSDVGDLVALITYLYREGPEPASLNHADMDCSGDVDPADIVVMINFVFKSGRLGCCR